MCLSRNDSVLSTSGNDSTPKKKINLDRKTSSKFIFFLNLPFIFKQEKWKDVVEDCTEALKLDDKYLKVLWRRANAYEKLEEFGKAATDYEEIYKLDPAQVKAKSTAEELKKKDMEKMMSNLKGIANKFLGFVGLSTDNFKVEKNETGNFNIQFVQNK